MAKRTKHDRLAVLARRVGRLVKKRELLQAQDDVTYDRLEKAVDELQSLCEHKKIFETPAREAFLDGQGFPPEKLPRARICASCFLEESVPFQRLTAAPSRVLGHKAFADLRIF